MPISKNKRTKPKKNALPLRKSKAGDTQGQSPVEALPSEVKKQSVRQMLLANRGEGLYRIVVFLPLFVGAWLAGGFVLSELLIFMLITVAVIFMEYARAIRDREDVIFIKDLRSLIYLAQAGLVYACYALANVLWLPLLLGGTLLVMYLRLLLPETKPLFVLGSALLLVLQLCCFSLLGIGSQLFAVHEPPVSVNWTWAILGYVPGMLLAAAVLLRNAEVLMRGGWGRSITKSKKDGRTVLRPRLLTSSYSLFALLGPGLVVASMPFNIFPLSMLAACVVLVVAAMRNCQALLEESASDETLVIRSLNVAALSEMLLLLAGLLSNFEIF